MAPSDLVEESPPVNSPDLKPRSRDSATIKRHVARNVAWNWIGLSVDVVAGFLLAPFLIYQLGNSVYGIWIVIGSLTGYAGRLDFGLRGSVGRHVAYYSGRNDQDGVIFTLNAAIGILAPLGAMAFGIVALCTYWLPHLVAIPASEINAAQTAFMIVGAHLGLFFIFRVFDATIWGFQRFDLLNAVDIPATIFQSVMSALVVYWGWGLIGLAGVTLTTTTIVGIAKLLVALREAPFLAISPRLFRWKQLWELLEYSIWNFMSSIFASAGRQLSPVVVGAILGIAVVTPFAIARRLVGYASMVLSASFGAITPMATEFYSQGDRYRQQQLFVRGGSFCLSIAVMFLILFALLGESLLVLWVGEAFRATWLPLMILAAGELIPMSVAASRSTIQGMAKHRPLAWRGLAEAVVGLGLGAILARHWGLEGMCVGLALGSTWFLGVFPFVYGCRLVAINPLKYLATAVLPILVSAMVPTLMLTLFTWWWPVTSWWGLLVSGTAFVTVYCSIMAQVLFTRDERRALIVGVFQRIQTRTA